MSDSLKFASLRGRTRLMPGRHHTEHESTPSLVVNPRKVTNNGPPSPNHHRGGVATTKAIKYTSTPTTSTFSSVVHSALRSTHRRWKSNDGRQSPSDESFIDMDISGSMSFGQDCEEEVELLTRSSEDAFEKVLVSRSAKQLPPPLLQPAPLILPPNPPTLSIYVPPPTLLMPHPYAETPKIVEPVTPPAQTGHHQLTTPAKSTRTYLTPQRPPPLFKGHSAPVVLRRALPPTRRFALPPVYPSVSSCEDIKEESIVLPLSPAKVKTSPSLSEKSSTSLKLPFSAVNLMQSSPRDDATLVTINVGGTIFSTTMSTIMATPSHLATWVEKNSTSRTEVLKKKASDRFELDSLEAIAHAKPWTSTVIASPSESIDSRGPMTCSTTCETNVSRIGTSGHESGEVDNIVRQGRIKSLHAQITMTTDKMGQSFTCQREPLPTSTSYVPDSPMDTFLRVGSSQSFNDVNDDEEEPESPTPMSKRLGRRRASSLSDLDRQLESSGGQGLDSIWQHRPSQYQSRHEFPTSPTTTIESPTLSVVPPDVRKSMTSLYSSRFFDGILQQHDEMEREDDTVVDERFARLTLTMTKPKTPTIDVENHSEDEEEGGIVTEVESVSRTSTLLDEERHVEFSNEPHSTTQRLDSTLSTYSIDRQVNTSVKQSRVELFLDRNPDCYTTIFHFLRSSAQSTSSVSLLPLNVRVPDQLPVECLSQDFLLQLWTRLCQLEIESNWLGLSFLETLVEAEKRQVVKLLKSKCNPHVVNKVVSKPGWI